MTTQVNVGAAKRRLLSPERIWRLKIDKSEWAARSATSGNPRVAMELVCTGSDSRGPVEGSEGVRVFHTQTLTDKTAFSTVELLAACFGEVQGDSDGQVSVDWGELVEIEVLASITLEDYQGRKQQRIGHFFHVDTPVAEDGSLVLEEEEIEMIGAAAE